MQDNAVTEARRLLPRWRSLARTPPHEIPATRVVAKERVKRKDFPLENALASWERTGSLPDASDVVDAAILSGNYSAVGSLKAQKVYVARFVVNDHKTRRHALWSEAIRARQCCLRCRTSPYCRSQRTRYAEMPLIPMLSR